MIGTQPATWRIMYKRAISGKRVFGAREREYLRFLDDIQNLYPSYVAVLECKELEGSPWTFVAYLLVTDFDKKEIILMNSYGERVTPKVFTKDTLRALLLEKPSYYKLKRVK